MSKRDNRWWWRQECGSGWVWVICVPRVSCDLPNHDTTGPNSSAISSLSSKQATESWILHLDIKKWSGGRVRAADGQGASGVSPSPYTPRDSGFFSLYGAGRGGELARAAPTRGQPTSSAFFRFSPAPPRLRAILFCCYGENPLVLRLIWCDNNPTRTRHFERRPWVFFISARFL